MSIPSNRLNNAPRLGASRPANNPLSPSSAKAIKSLQSFVDGPSPQAGLGFVKTLNGTLFEHKNNKPDVIGNRQAGSRAYNALNGLVNGESSQQVAKDIQGLADSRVVNNQAISTAATLANGIAASKPGQKFTGSDVRRVLDNPDVSKGISPDVKTAFNTIADNLDSLSNITEKATASPEPAQNSFAYNLPGANKAQENQQDLNKQLEQSVDDEWQNAIS